MKYEIGLGGAAPYKSPSMRREWIEIQLLDKDGKEVEVSLHAEGVD